MYITIIGDERLFYNMRIKNLSDGFDGYILNNS